MVKVVAFAGHAGSGKSTQVALLAEQWGGHRASFGDLVRAQTQRGGLDATQRQVLMDAGHRWATEDAGGIAEALLATVSSSASLLVVDGIRHVAVLQAMAVAVGARVHLVYLDVSEASLRTRLGPEGVDPLHHPSEAEMPRLKELAHLVVDGEAPMQRIAEEVEVATQSWFPTLAEANVRVGCD